MHISVLLITGLLLAAAPGVRAQTKNPVRTSTPDAASLKDGVFRQDGVTMRLQAGQVSRLSAPLTLENGAVVRTNGIIVSSNGTRQLLPDHHAITMQGAIVLLRDDMLTPRAIDEHAQAVTGSTGETRFTALNVTGNSAAMSPRLTAKLLRTEQRLALLEDMTSRLERRTKVKSAVVASLDQQLSEVNAQIRQLSQSAGNLPAAPPAEAPH